MSARRRQGAVLRLLRGEVPARVSREPGVTAAELTAPGRRRPLLRRRIFRRLAENGGTLFWRRVKPR